ncbi:hypothetical protein [Alicyclobacillus fastidiosus]|uniref:hypothetical protein n=1 Tax=Alicyclobacillus fastidiosus TaxID=392011 RepID=UPI0024E090B2|nr:hypothetical protein [Alicyclobacillus fastidiosus]
MDNEIFSNNLACLPQYLKDLLPPPSNHEMYWQSVQIATGKNGWPVGIYRMENNHTHTNSFVDPWAEAQQWAASINYKDTKVSIIYGCGFGYPSSNTRSGKRPIQKHSSLSRTSNYSMPCSSVSTFNLY